ncbi:uncharacterized protein DNG_07420 [Cephalotrichum gorgonifer]|uniref:Uncharacterized protein n=1 Tax=Cephalotrichum gorgonifer TaxID=2041049 RepID=A0AAE8N4K0_9PEZI|nr:uncharacterized protein DNG_07420 [Cephalotrichum gorgonifer]
MCYFDQKRWKCGYWRWGQFRRQCPKEYRTGETCGLKLVMNTFDEAKQCRLCDDIDKKTRRLSKMATDMSRWRREGNRSATIERTESEYRQVEKQMYEMQMQHYERVHGAS